MDAVSRSATPCSRPTPPVWWIGRPRRALSAYHAAHPLRTGMDPSSCAGPRPQEPPTRLVARVLDRLLEQGALRMRGRPPRRSRFRAVTLGRPGGPAPAGPPDAFHDAGLRTAPAGPAGEDLGGPETCRNRRPPRADGTARPPRARPLHAPRPRRPAGPGRPGPVRRPHDVGPPEFREVIPVSSKHLIPILEFLDRSGVTVRKGRGPGRATAVKTPVRSGTCGASPASADLTRTVRVPTMNPDKCFTFRQSCGGRSDTLLPKDVQCGGNHEAPQLRRRHLPAASSPSLPLPGGAGRGKRSRGRG
jgi:hypothetical protein